MGGEGKGGEGRQWEGRGEERKGGERERKGWGDERKRRGGEEDMYKYVQQEQNEEWGEGGGLIPSPSKKKG